MCKYNKDCECHLHNPKPQRSKDPSETPLSKCEDVELLRETVELLWGIIDEIDTTSDIAKGNDEWYRKRVERWQAERWKSKVTTEGYELLIKA